ncbi:MAG: hypothetical protein RRZ64_08130 [Rikenellaceae bacterium]
MGNFLSFIFITILTIYLLGFLGRLFFRIWISRKLKEIERNGGASPNGQPFFWSKSWGGAAPKSPKEGSVKVTKVTEDARTVDKKLGEYVEYEEVDEEIEK